MKDKLATKFPIKKEVLVSLLIGTVFILLVSSYLLGTDYLKQLKGHEPLTSQISEVSQTLAQLTQLPQPPQDLEQRLAEAEASLAALASAFPGKMSSNEVINTILKLADDCEVKAVPLLTQPWSTEKVGEHDYDVFRLNLTVAGSFSQLVSFTSKLENGEFKTLIIEKLSVTTLNGQSEEESAAEEIIPIMASLDLAIYAQSLSSD